MGHESYPSAHEQDLCRIVLQSACCHEDWDAEDHLEYVIYERPDVQLHYPLSVDRGLLRERIQQWLDAPWFATKVQQELESALDRA